MLKDTLKNKIYDYVKAKGLCEQLGMCKNAKVSFLAQGEYNINFTLEGASKKYVLRVNTGSQLELDNQIEYEYEALLRLYPSGVTPRPYFVDGSKQYIDYGILVMEFLEGAPLDYGRDMEKAAGIFSRIHSMDIERMDASNFIFEKTIFSDRVSEARRLLKDFMESTVIDCKLKKFFADFMDWAEKNACREGYFTQSPWNAINNTEVNSGNFIINDKRQYLIDWEKPVISDPCQDITQFLAPTTTLWKTSHILSEHEKEKFFKSYTSGLECKDKDIRERVQLYTPYLYLRALSWCAFAYLEYMNPDKSIKNMDTFEKIKSYLDIDFMNGLLRGFI
ncbi:aminoglycoside phosphotransferase [Peptoclostridium acidaminophilum DSM 3953]|uniref:Aminoglycoside phosphotransferase n=1 Tax=Peptoclostridium acidaminophilum DSM 3953 TaxID=1286171 RepID=W8TGT2_PEPAC|nr:phosphotransferase [Peptoclostridium acidaminophilum]AHM57043.1 aminoglycoside phosphotransferase [Peptoclostridium acidaminophilum DSM 3953]